MSPKQAPAGNAPVAGDRLQVRIEKMAIGGAGIARADGFVLFVDLAVPGDLLSVEVTSSKGRHGEARIVEVLEPGPSRREPPCSYADRCGGCNWQQITEDEQLRQKDLLLRETFAKFLPSRSIPFEPFVPSPRALRYRNRVQPRMKDGRLGYYRRKSHEFLPVNDCLITEERLAAFFKNPPPVPAGPETRVELRLSQDDVPQWSLQGGVEAEGFSFSQVNRFQNRDLIETVLRWSSGRNFSEIWDLYCGGGNFTFPLAERFAGASFVGVELDAKLVTRAREQAAGSKNMNFYSSDVAAWLRHRGPGKNSLVVLDPPRAGAGPEVMRALANSEAEEILYIACHPVGLARDVATFFKEASRPWVLSKVQGFEMFPQTDHMETLVHLKAQVASWP